MKRLRALSHVVSWASNLDFPGFKHQEFPQIQHCLFTEHILKEMGIPNHLTCFLRNLYVGQEAMFRTGHGATDWFQIGKGVCQGCILSLCLFNLYAEYIMRNAGLEETQARIKIARRNINNLRYADVQFSSVTQSCLTLCDPMNCSTPGLPVHHHLPEFTQTHVHRVGDAIQPSHPPSSPFPSAPNPSQN